MVTIEQPLKDAKLERVQAVPWRENIHAQRRLGLIVAYALLIPGAILFLLPFLWMLSTALKGERQMFLYPPQIIPDPMHPENFIEGWSGYLPFNTFLMNSVKITLNNIVGNLVSCTLAAYAFARLKARGKNILFTLLLGILVLPMEVILVPQYILFTQLGWNNTHLPLMVPPWFGWAFFVFLLRQFFMTIPQELIDAALIDGASHFQILWRIVVPLSKPALATVALLAFVGNWNNFLGPLVYLRDEGLQTLPVGLRYFYGAFGGVTAYHHVMAVGTLILLPVLIVFLIGQRLYIQGITLTGLNR